MKSWEMERKIARDIWPRWTLLLISTLEPRLSLAFCQRLVAGRNSGIMEFLWIFFEFFDWLFAEQQPIKKFQKYSKKFHYPRVSLGDQLLTKSRRNSGLEIALLPPTRSQSIYSSHSLQGSPGAGRGETRLASLNAWRCLLLFQFYGALS